MRLEGAVEARRVRDRLCRSDIFSVNTNRTLSRFVVWFTPRYSASTRFIVAPSRSLGARFPSQHHEVRVCGIVSSESLKRREEKKCETIRSPGPRSVTETMPGISSSSSRRGTREETRERGWKSEERPTIPDFWRNRTMTLSGRIVFKFLLLLGTGHCLRAMVSPSPVCEKIPLRKP